MYVITPELAHSARTLPAFVQQSAQQRCKEFGEFEVATISCAAATIELSSRTTSSLCLLLEFHYREPDKALIFATVVAHRPSLRDSTGQPGAPDLQFTISASEKRLFLHELKHPQVTASGHRAGVGCARCRSPTASAVTGCKGPRPRQTKRLYAPAACSRMRRASSRRNC